MVSYPVKRGISTIRCEAIIGFLCYCGAVPQASAESRLSFYVDQPRDKIISQKYLWGAPYRSLPYYLSTHYFTTYIYQFKAYIYNCRLILKP